MSRWAKSMWAKSYLSFLGEMAWAVVDIIPRVNWVCHSSEHRVFEEGLSVAVSRDRRPSEFGGRPGMIQPPPHEPTHIEQARLERMANPADPEADKDSVLAEKRASGEYESTPE